MDEASVRMVMFGITIAVGGGLPALRPASGLSLRAASGVAAAECDTGQRL